MILTSKQVLFRQKSTTKEEAIKVAGKILLENQYIEPTYIDSMLEKEQTDITYIGNGIAIPHGLSEAKEYVNHSGISVVHYPDGINYNDDKAYLIIGIAGKDGDHLEILQDLAVKLSEMDYVNSLVNAVSIEEFIQIFNQ